MCFNSGGGSASTTNTTESYQLNDNSAGDVSGSKLGVSLAGSNENQITVSNTVSDSGAIDAGKQLGLASIASTQESFKTFASQLSSSSDKSIDAVRMASASQTQQANSTFTDLFKVLAFAAVGGIFLLNKGKK